LGVALDVTSPVADLPVGYMQFIEIAREISRDGVKLLVFDEPTAVLTETEADVFLDALERIRDKGISVIFISHRLPEILKASDRIVVFRDGRMVAELSAGSVGAKDLAELMVGRDVSLDARDRRRVDESGASVALSVRGLRVDMPGEYVRDVSFDVLEGEIFGIGGLAGQGKLGVANGVMGLFHAEGEVVFGGQSLPLNDTLAVMRRGVCFVSEDRKGVGLLLDESIVLNVTFVSMQVKGEFLKKRLGGLVSFRDEKAMAACAREYIDRLEIRCSSERQKVRQLSGGNQQKVCLAKAFAFSPKLLFVSEPTRGVDVGAKSLVLNALKAFAEENAAAVVITSSELEELRSVCDRIAIVSEGRVADILPSTADAVDFALLMSAIKRGGA
jgi:simple sugar transport system ATP-binding protein